MVFFNWIQLYPNITIPNYLASLVHYFVMTFIFVSVESLQPMLFQNRYGTQNGNIILIDIITKCIFAPLVGILSDKFGRKIILQLGILITSLSLGLMSIATNIYPYYLLCRIFYAVGAIILATMPFLADYVQDDFKGRAAALNVVLAALGAVFSATVIMNVLKQFAIYVAYLVVSISFLVFGLSYTIFLKGGVYFKKQHKIEDSDQPLNNSGPSTCPIASLIEQDPNYKQILELQNRTDCMAAMKIATIAGKNQWIFQGYITNFLGRGDSILLTLSLVIWCQQYVKEDDEEEAYKEANIKAQTLSGITYTVIMVFALLYGILFEKVSNNILLIVMFILTLIGCVMMNFVEGPYTILTFITMIILGSGMSGLYTAALYLINKYAYVQYRGYISGLANVFSVLGILVCSLVGGIIQDKWNKTAPFNLFALMSFIGLILVYINMVKTKKVNEKKPVE